MKSGFIAGSTTVLLASLFAAGTSTGILHPTFNDKGMVVAPAVTAGAGPTLLLVSQVFGLHFACN
jgi:hypothetical protein